MVNQHENAVVIYVGDNLDVASAPGLASLISLIESGRKQRIVVSLERCTYCYAAGLSVLALAHRRIGSDFFVVVPASARFRRVFEVSGLSKILQLLPTVQGALDALAVSAA